MNATVIRTTFADWSNQPCWLIANARKIPCDRRGAPLRDWTNKGATLQQALAFVDGRNAIGVGLNLNRARGVLMLDFDDCVDAEGRITSALAVHLLHQRPTYAERSVSGRGLHLAYCIPADAPPISLKTTEVEAYAHTARFVLVTGDLHPYGTVRLADAPPDLIAKLQSRQPVIQVADRLRPSDEADKPFSLADFVRSAPEGERNNRLFWSACRCAERGLAVADATALLLPAALAVGLAEREARATIASAYKRPPRTPRRVESANPTRRVLSPSEFAHRVRIR